MNVVTRGPSYFQFAVRVDSCRVELFIDSFDRAKNEELFDALASRSESIHRSLGADLVWENKQNVRSNRVFRVPEGGCGYRSPARERQAGYDILADAMYRLHETFMPHIEKLV